MRLRRLSTQFQRQNIESPTRTISGISKGVGGNIVRIFYQNVNDMHARDRGSPIKDNAHWLDLAEEVDCGKDWIESIRRRLRNTCIQFKRRNFFSSI